MTPVMKEPKLQVTLLGKQPVLQLNFLKIQLKQWGMLLVKLLKLERKKRSQTMLMKSQKKKETTQKKKSQMMKETIQKKKSLRKK